MSNNIFQLGDYSGKAGWQQPIIDRSNSTTTSLGFADN